MHMDLASGGPDAGPDPRRALGRLGEGLAAAHLHGLDYAILARNARTRHGEIDLIAFDGYTLAMVEVKTRRVGARARGVRPDQQPLAGLRRSQRARLRRLAAAWLADEEHPRARAIRFDAIGVVVDSAGRLVCLEHLKGAW